MNRTEWHEAADASYEARIRTYTLSELEDVYAHLDRRVYPQRFEMVRQEIERRLVELDARGDAADEAATEKVGIFRRLWGGLVDLFVQVLILCALFLVWWAVSGLIQSFGAEETVAQVVPPRRRQASPFMLFLTGIFQGKPEAWGNLQQWKTIGLWLLGILLYKAVLTIPAWARSGFTPGMREVGVKLVHASGGRLSAGRALIRFVGQYALLVLTVGVSGLWMLWDRRGQTLHDKLAGTRMVRMTRTWEKPMEARLLDDDD